MKPVSFIILRLAYLFPLLFIYTHLDSKPDPLRAKKIPPYFFVKLYTQGQYFFYKQQEGILEVKFPYMLSSGNTSTTAVFSASKTNLTGAGKFSYTFPCLEIGYGRFSVDANMNFVTGPVWGWTDNFYFGLNYRLPSPFLFLRPGSINGAAVLPDAPTAYNSWRVVFHLGVLYYHPLYELGEINTGEEHFYAAGQILPERDTTVAYPGNVKVYFQQNTISIAPGFELAYQSKNKVVDFGIRIAPLIMIEQEGGLRFRYKNFSQMKHAPGGYNLRYIALNTDGIEAKYNGATVSETPFRLQGFMISVNVGLRFGG
jgi:hypothetical protein